MEVHVRLTGLLQRVDLATGSMVNMLELELEDGFKIEAPIAEVEAERILRIAVGAPAPTMPSAEAPSFPPYVAMPDAVDPLMEREVMTDAHVAFPPQPVLPKFPSNSYTKGFGRVTKAHPAVPPFRTVPTDEMGNPVIVFPQATAPDSFSLDEDGVPTA
jgi:hypothetical protein